MLDNKLGERSITEATQSVLDALDNTLATTAIKDSRVDYREGNGHVLMFVARKP